MKLRAYQNSAVERVLALFARGVRRVLLVLPTGGGKTVIFSELVRICLEKYGPAIVLAHRRELIKQTFAKLVRNGLPVGNVGIIMAGVPFRASSSFLTLPPEQCTDDELWTFYALRRPAAGVHVGSIDTFRNVSKPAAKLIVVDEAHRALAASYQAVQRDYPDAFHLGVTATPFRADGKGLGEAYDEIVVAATYQDLVDDPDGPFLVIPDCYGTEKKADLSAIKKAGGDYNAKQLAHAVDKGELIGDLVEHWIKLGNNAPTFAFAVNVAHSMHIARRFCEAGIPAKHVDGNTETNERDLPVRAARLSA
jgi:superfamily II DNA or RNA helicase